MQVPTLDLHTQLLQFEDELKAAVLAVIDSGKFILGPEVGQLEAAIAAYTGANSGIGVSSGTDALLVSLMALDIGPGDLVLTTNYSFFATAGVICRLGATPIFIDIDPLTFNISTQLLAQWFDDNPGLVNKVKAIVPVHLYGQCADMDPILALAEKNNCQVVEDAAQAIGAYYPSQKLGKRLGAGSIANLGCFSFFPSKNLGGLGDGGMVTAKTEALAEKVRILRVHGSKPKYHHSIVGGNFRLDTIQAAALLVKLRYLDGWHQKRRDLAERYNKSFDTLELTTPTCLWDAQDHIYNQYVITTDRRDELKQHLRKNDISSAIYYPVPFHRQKCFATLPYLGTEYPQSDLAANTSLALPVYPEMTSDMQDYVIETIHQFFGQQ